MQGSKCTSLSSFRDVRWAAVAKLQPDSQRKGLDKGRESARLIIKGEVRTVLAILIWGTKTWFHHSWAVWAEHVFWWVWWGPFCFFTHRPLQMSTQGVPLALRLQRDMCTRDFLGEEFLCHQRVRECLFMGSCLQRRQQAQRSLLCVWRRAPQHP